MEKKICYFFTININYMLDVLNLAGLCRCETVFRNVIPERSLAFGWEIK